MIGPANDAPASEGQPGARSGYYGVPVIHRPPWKWLIIAYFFLGGISGASSVIAGAARLVGARENRTLSRRGAYVALAALAPCPALLILDLGRPRRFLNMLRVFKTSSPMSVGTWGLAAYGAVAALNAGLQVREDLSDAGGRGAIRPSGAARLLAALVVPLGIFASGYAGVLLAATAVPLWSKRPSLLGPLFLSSAMTSGAASIGLVMAIAGDSEPRGEPLARFEALSSLAEGGLLLAWTTALGPTAAPILEGRTGKVTRVGVVGMGIVAPLVASALARGARGRSRRALSALGSTLALAGGFALRYVVVEGGRASADDPRATFDLTN